MFVRGTTNNGYLGLAILESLINYINGNAVYLGFNVKPIEFRLSREMERTNLGGPQWKVRLWGSSS